MPNMIQIIKQAAVEAVEASGPMRTMYGTVVSSSPVRIRIDQKYTISSPFIVLTRGVTDYDTKMEVDGVEQDVKIKNGLKSGDRVILMQEQGGQRYIVLDKVGG